MVKLFYTCTTYISVDLAHREIFRAKVDKGGIKSCHALGATMLAFWERLQVLTIDKITIYICVRRSSF